MPRYQHDCKECIFVGEDTPRDPKEGKVYIDIYIHMGWREGIAFLTRRWGNGKYDKEEKSAEKAKECLDMRWGTTLAMVIKKGFKV